MRLVINTIICFDSGETLIMMWTLGPFNEYISQAPQKNDKSLLWTCGLQDADQTTYDAQEQPPLTSSAA